MKRGLLSGSPEVKGVLRYHVSRVSVCVCQTPSTGLRHPSFNKVPETDARQCVNVCVKLQALVYDILPSTTAVFVVTP